MKQEGPDEAYNLRSQDKSKPDRTNPFRCCSCAEKAVVPSWTKTTVAAVYTEIQGQQDPYWRGEWEAMDWLSSLRMMMADPKFELDVTHLLMVDPSNLSCTSQILMIASSPQPSHSIDLISRGECRVASIGNVTLVSGWESVANGGGQKYDHVAIRMDVSVYPCQKIF